MVMRVVAVRGMLRSRRRMDERRMDEL